MAQPGVESKGVVQPPGPPSTPMQPDAVIAEPKSVSPLELYNASPRRAKTSAISRYVHLGEADPARTPTSEVHSYRHTGGSDVEALKTVNRWCATMKSVGTSYQIRDCGTLARAKSPCHSCWMSPVNTDTLSVSFSCEISGKAL
jgi:hypothetical protein